jgi:hypothetical protein
LNILIPLVRELKSEVNEARLTQPLNIYLPSSNELKIPLKFCKFKHFSNVPFIAIE